MKCDHSVKDAKQYFESSFSQNTPSGTVFLVLSLLIKSQSVTIYTVLKFLWCCLLCCTKWFSFWSVDHDKIVKCNIQLKANKQPFLVLLCKVFFLQTFENVKEIIRCGHSVKDATAVLRIKLFTKYSVWNSI